MKRETAAWRARFADAPPLLLEYVEARGVFVCALRVMNAAAERLRLAEEASGKAFESREIRRDLETVVRSVRASTTSEARRKYEARYGITAREAGAMLRKLPTLADELRASSALAVALADFHACADLVDEAARIVTRRHYVWRRWEAARDLAAASFGVSVCRYVPRREEKANV